ncbi:MAG: hypothetical protein U0572_09390 [Phycisphaerales bacterium]
MMRRLLRSLAFVACVALLAMSAQDSTPKRDWGPRLARLDPAWPRVYFEMAEDVADAATNAQEKELARTLFGLAGVLDRETYARSSALALAALSEEPRRKRALLALAALLSAEASAPEADIGEPDPSTRRPSVAAAVALSEAFSFYRRGQGPRALGIVKAADVDALLSRYGAGSPGGADRFREDCRAYKSGLRPEPPPDVHAAMLAIEEAVLASAATTSGTVDRERGWSSVLIETGSRPLVEIDATHLEEAFGVDPARPYWRDGKWVNVK